MHSIASLKQAIDALIRSIPDTLELPAYDTAVPVTVRFDAQRHVEKLERAMRKLYGRERCGIRTSRFWHQRHATAGLRGNCQRLHALLERYHDAAVALRAQLAGARSARDDTDLKSLQARCHALINQCITCTEQLAACRSEIPKVKRRSCMRLILRVSIFVMGIALSAVFAPITVIVSAVGLILSFWEYWRERNNSAWNALDGAVKAFAAEVITLERILQARSARIAEAHLHELACLYQALKHREDRSESWLGEIASGTIHHMAVIDSLERSVTQIAASIVDCRKDADEETFFHLQDKVRAAMLPLRRLHDAPSTHPARRDARRHGVRDPYRWEATRDGDTRAGPPGYDAPWAGPPGYGALRVDAARSGARRRHISLPALGMPPIERRATIPHGASMPALRWRATCWPESGYPDHGPHHGPGHPMPPTPIHENAPLEDRP